MTHQDIQELLYDYACGETDPTLKQQVDHHLDACPVCRQELADMRATLALIPQPAGRPSDRLDDEYWRSLARDIEREIRRENSRQVHPVRDFFRTLFPVESLRPAHLAAALGTVAVVAAALIVFRLMPQQSVNVTDRPAHEVASPAGQGATSRRVSDYLRKSRVLLVGIANDEPGETRLRAQRVVSRDLIHEGRYLRGQEMDQRSRKLIRDLEKILIELASLEETYGHPDIEVIRGGIRQENLLFKIRMAEAALRDTSGTSNDKVF